MNIEQAKSIALSVILGKLNFLPQREKNHESWYLSPLRDEKTASFHVNSRMNVWFDFGVGRGGDIIDFACAYLESKDEAHTVSDALRFIKNICEYAGKIQNVVIPDYSKEDGKLELRSVKQIEHLALINYLEKRGIPVAVGKRYLKEVRVFNKESKKTLFALGLKNEEDGYELRNPNFKGCVGSKTISFIRGRVAKPEGVHIFEGFMDFLTLVTQSEDKKLEDDAIILNSLSCMSQATPYIRNYGYRDAYAWLDNDKSGEEATEKLSEFFRTEQDLRHKKMNGVYRSFKDLNAAHMHKLGL